MDLVLGDPEWFPHPVRWFGLLISAGDRWLRRRWLRQWGGGPRREMLAGAALTGSVVSIAWLSGRSQNAILQVLLAWTALATRSLLDEARTVIQALEAHDLERARRRLARIVGRDTGHLSESEIATAVIETLAESSCDGIVAPLFWLAAGGVPCAMAYKAVNTLDSMIGHPEPPYRYFGRVAARLDDAVNLVPARLTALGIVAGAKIRGLDAAQARQIWRRDGGKHASPNAGFPEATMAGALGIELGGDAIYAGEIEHRVRLGRAERAPKIDDIATARRLMRIATALGFGVLALLRYVLTGY